MPSNKAIKSTLKRLIYNYQSLNSQFPSEISHSPTPLEFSSFVGSNRPLVLRGEGDRMGMKAISDWDESYLCEKLGDSLCDVAVTPDGYLLLSEFCVDKEEDLI